MRAPGHAVEIRRPHARADRRVDVARREDRRAAAGRQRGDAGLAAPVEPARLGQQPVGHQRLRAAGLGVGEEGLGVHARILHPVERQIEPPLAGILAHVAGDIGQLHRHAHVAGPRQRIGIAHAHDHRHHRAHGRGHSRRIGPDLGNRLVPPAHRVPGEALEQRLGQRAGHLDRSDHIGERAVGGVVLGAPGIGGVQPLAQPQHGGGFLVDQVDRVVGQPAEGIERQRRVAHPRGKQPRGGVEALGAVADRHPAGLDILGAHRRAQLRPAPHCAAIFSAAAAAPAGAGSGTSLSSTSAEDTTPGSPAPGCEPAPTM